jgi:hypothetical protein
MNHDGTTTILATVIADAVNDRITCSVLAAMWSIAPSWYVPLASSKSKLTVLTASSSIRAVHIRELYVLIYLLPLLVPTPQSSPMYVRLPI